MTSDIELTEIEKEAKNFFMKLLCEGSAVPCDNNSNENTLNYDLPSWYNETKYKKGQKYFFNNRLGILNSNLVALACLLAEPKGLKILESTGRSSTKETARKRYVSTILHTLSWYEIDLAPGSKSWESLKKVRRMHLCSSNTATAKKLGHISQMELTLTAFGFMGFVLIRPHVLGIRHDNQEDILAFVHLWATICHMLGIKEEYNMCLLRLETIKMVCAMFLRYLFVPLLQIETPLFKEMMTALFDGLAKFMPHMSYDVQIFLARRVACVPGYQFKLDKQQEVLCRSILNDDDFWRIKEAYKNLDGYEHLQTLELGFTTNVPIILFERNHIKNSIQSTNGYGSNSETNRIEISRSQAIKEYAGLKSHLELEDGDRLDVSFLNYENDWPEKLNDLRFYDLSPKDQKIINLKVGMLPLYQNWLGRYVCEALISVVLFFMRCYQKKNVS